MNEGVVHWRAHGPYQAGNSSKAGVFHETRQALLLYARLGDVESTRRELLEGGLPQRSRASREGVVERIHARLARWNPPSWVCADLVAAARADGATDLQALLLLHAVRQDTLLYDVVQRLIVPRWRSGEQQVVRADVQRLFDEMEPVHPELGRWSHQTRQKLAGNSLSILADYGLLHGTATRRMVEPVVPAAAVTHLERLLREEGISPAAIPLHPDWQLWLLEASQVGILLGRHDGSGVA